MPLTLDLPKPLDDEILLEAQREGVSAQEHVSLVLCLVTALLQEDRSTPFQEAVKLFLSHRSMNADQVVSAFEELVHVCLEAHEDGKEHDLSALALWRNAVVHRPLDIAPNIVVSTISRLEELQRTSGRVSHRSDNGQDASAQDVERAALLIHIKSIRGKYAHLGVTSEDVRREREQDEEISRRQLGEG